MDHQKIKEKVQRYLDEKITLFMLKGKGAVNYAYYVETDDGRKYIVKQERDDKEFQPQNDLAIEAKVAEKLYSLNLSVPIPKVVFISEDPKMYGYEYIEGDLMRGVWGNLSESERIDICRKLGSFHAEIGKKFTKEMAEIIGIKIDMSQNLHPEVSADYDRLILDVNVPENFKTLAKGAKSIFDRTQDKLIFQFLHNDSHHENIIIKDKNISGIIDFGNAEYGETAKEFSRYIRDFPDYFQYIVSAYEEKSGNQLSYERLVSNALLSGFIDIVESYQKGGDDRIQAENAIEKYRTLITGITEKVEETPIREMGRYFDVDLEGYLINPASKEKIQEEWQPIVNDIIEKYKSQYGDKLHSVYVRGSVGKGDAVSGVSDVDTFAYVTLNKETIKTDWMDSFEKEMSAKYPFAQGVELSVDPVEDAPNDRILILQSACVYGQDLNSEMPKVKVGKETLGHVYSFAKNLTWFDEWSSKPQEKEEMKKSCTWLMKRFLRTGLELTMERAGLYTRDLYPSYKIFAEYYPEKEVEMKEVLYLALNPTDDLDLIKRVRSNLGVWLEEQTKSYKKDKE